MLGRHFSIGPAAIHRTVTNKGRPPKFGFGEAALNCFFWFTGFY